MNKKTWYLTPKSQEEKQDVPFIIGGLYKRSDDIFCILARVVDDGYFFVRISVGETTTVFPLTKSKIQEELNKYYILVAEQIEVKP